MNWENSQLGYADLFVRRGSGPDPLVAGYGIRSNRFIPSPWEIGPQVTFSGLVTGGTGYLGISFLSGSQGFAPWMKEVDERFPPLADRIPQWTTAKLASEVGNSRRAGFLLFGQFKRDGILVHALLTRADLTMPVFRDLLNRRAGNRPSMAGEVLPEMIRAAIETKRADEFAEAICEYLTTTHPGSHHQSVILSALKSAGVGELCQ